MSTLLEKDVKAITIEYLPTDDEKDKSKPLTIGQGLLDNFHRSELLGYKTLYGVKRYLTGLDDVIVEHDPSLSDQDKKERISKIKGTVEKLERFFGKGNLDATNEKLWGEVKLVIDRKTTNLDLTDPKNEILFHCIKAGGFTEVAPSIEEAIEKRKKFYLIEPLEFVENRVAPRKIIGKAIATLVDIYEKKGFDDIFFLAKYLLPVDKAYVKKTPKSLMYEDLDKFINGELIRKSKMECARMFLDAVKKPKSHIIVYCLVKDAFEYFNFIYTNTSGELKNNETGGLYGTTIERAVDHLLTPAFEHELENIKYRVEKKWTE